MNNKKYQMTAFGCLFKYYSNNNNLDEMFRLLDTFENIWPYIDDKYFIQLLNYAQEFSTNKEVVENTIKEYKKVITNLTMKEVKNYGKN